MDDLVVEAEAVETPLYALLRVGIEKGLKPPVQLFAPQDTPFHRSYDLQMGKIASYILGIETLSRFDDIGNRFTFEPLEDLRVVCLPKLSLLVLRE